VCEHVLSDEDTSVEAVITRWLHNQDEDDRDVLGGWIKDYFYDALKWVLEQVRRRKQWGYAGDLTPQLFMWGILICTPCFIKKTTQYLIAHNFGKC